MNKKLILLCVIVLIIILLGCMFITNEGFNNKDMRRKEWCDTLDNVTSSCKQSTDCLGLIYSECVGDTNPDCEWENNQCALKCERLTEVKCNNNSSICTLSSNKCSTKDKDVDCNKITITNDGNKIELPINTVCPTDPNCVQVCINDHTWINKDGLNNNNTNGFGEQVSGSLKNANDTHLLTSSGCMQCIKNFYPIVNLIDKHECTF